MTFKHNEDTRVKIPLVAHLTRLGYDYLDKPKDIDSRNNIFKSVFKESIEKINKRTFTEDEIMDILDEIHSLSKYDDLGKALYNKITSQSNADVKLIDFENINNNSFNVVTELKFINKSEFRPDVTILINGMPLIIFEVKKPNVVGLIDSEFKRNDERLSNPNYKHFFNFIQLILISNNMEYESSIDKKSGSYYTTPNSKYTTFNKFREDETLGLERDIKDLKFILKDNNCDEDLMKTPEFKTNIDENNPINSFATSILTKDRLFFILQYGLSYLQFKKEIEGTSTTILQKHIIRYQQLFSVLKCRNVLDKGIKKGIFWQTQGSGKTSLALFLADYLTDYYSKQSKIVQFYFIVDRLELLNQTVSEFEARGVTSNTVDSKWEFKELLKSSKGGVYGQKISMTVVNIHKFDEIEIEDNSYAPNVQRFYIMDEAHRSYNPDGSFLKNLINSDKDAIHIALTGTPLISKAYNTTDIFGNYIHKYYYDKSIADGYTLRIMKQQILTEYKEELDEIQKSLLSQLSAKKNTISKDMIYENEKYCDSLGKYISNDFIDFRKNQSDNSLGGMIVCNSKAQGKVTENWFKKNSPSLNVKLVVDDVDKNERKIIQNDFKKGLVDIVIVYQMLLTGFDSPRLKRLYLLRVIREHNLLQALTRVNRPYRNPITNKSYEYGYIVDFAGIDEEYNQTNLEYLKELEKDIKEVDGEFTFDTTFLDINNLVKILNDTKVSLKDYTLDNLEIFDGEISLKDLNELYRVKNLLLTLESLYNNFGILDKSYNHKIDINRVRSALKIINQKIFNHNINAKINENGDISEILNDVLNGVDFEFNSSDEVELTISENGLRAELKDLLEKTQFEYDRNFDKEDDEIVSLYDQLKEVLNDVANMNKTHIPIPQTLEKLKELLSKIKENNSSNDEIINSYNDEKCARIHKRLLREKVLTIEELDSVHNYIIDIKKTADEENSKNSNTSKSYASKQLYSLAGKKIKESLKGERRKKFCEIYIEEYFK